MAFTPIPIGSLSWGTPVNNALADQDARITDLEAAGGNAVDLLGFVATNYDPALAPGGTVLGSNPVYMMRLDIPEDTTVNAVVIGVVTAGSGLTADRNWAGLYDAAGTRLGVSADQTTAWASTGEKVMSLMSPVAVTAGTYYAAILCNASTPISPLRGVSLSALATLFNHGLTGATARWTIGPTGQATLPATVDMAARSLSGNTIWVGLT
jgi:hypothetical protein